MAKQDPVIDQTLLPGFEDMIIPGSGQSDSGDTDQCAVNNNHGSKDEDELAADSRAADTDIWNSSAIDDMANLFELAKKAKDFKMMGEILEAASKVYSQRVDALHEDVLGITVPKNELPDAQEAKEDDQDEKENINQNG